MDSMPEVTYGILGLSITIATFLPALVYSYSEGLLAGLMKPKMEENEDVWKRIISFIFTNDLILTQSMIQVFFSALYGVLIFTSFIVEGTNPYLYIVLFTFPALLFLFLHWSYAYFYSGKKIDDFKTYEIESKKIIEYWVSYPYITKWWKIFTLINLSVTSALSLYIFYIQNDLFAFFTINDAKIFFICFLSVILISYSVSWLIPLILHRPLTSEVEDYIKIREAAIQNKNNTNNNQTINSNSCCCQSMPTEKNTSPQVIINTPKKQTAKKGNKRKRK